MLLFIALTIALISTEFCPFVSCKSQYVEPLNTGLHFGIPYDIANIFIRPIAGVTSFILTVGLGIILFFGVITSPFGYFFGIPSRKYVLGGQNTTRTDIAGERQEEYAFEPILALDSASVSAGAGLNTMEFLNMQPRSLHMQPGQIGHEHEEESGNYPTFLQSIFKLFPDDEHIPDLPCSLKLVCYAHGSFQYMPPVASRLYKIFSKYLLHIPAEYKQAIIIGLQSDHHHLCENMYKDCSKSLTTLLVKTVTKLLPERARRKSRYY